MNCLECFNRPRVDGLQIVCSPFFVLAAVPPLRRSGALVGIRYGVLPRMHICARPGALVGIRHGVLPRMHICALPVPSLASGMEYCHGCTFAPCLVPSLASGMEYCHGCTFAPAGALVGIRHGVLPRMHICARWCPLHHVTHIIANHRF